jgi:hypothetical protein
MRRGHSRVQAMGRVGTARWLAPTLLALATILTIAAAYRQRPFVAIDVGDYYDTVFLPNLADSGAESGDFYAREVNAVGAEQVTPWPATQAALELPGRRQGIWQVTVEAATNLPDKPLAGLALSANGVRLWIPRSDARTIVAVIPPEIASAEQLQLRLEPGLADDPAPPLGLAGQVRLAQARTYRWSSGQGTISLPGLGRGDWVVTFVASLRHPDNKPLHATVSANDVPIAQLPDGDLRRLSFLVPATLVPDGDLTIKIKSNTYSDPRDLGVLLYEVSVAPAGPNMLLPPLRFLLYALLIAIGLYFCILRMTLRPTLAAALALALIVGGGWALAVARYPTAFMLPRLAILAVWSMALLLVLERLLPWAFAKAGVPLSPWLLRGLLAIFFAGYWLKAGGMLYPYFVGIDMRRQISWALQIYNGQFWLFYGTNNPMNELTMPVSQWGTTKPVIPYSPWFHIFIGSFSLLPIPIVLAGHMFSALVDTSRVFLLALLARKSRFSEREALFATLLLAVTPATFLLHSWGNIPTTFGIWWTLVSTVFIVVGYRRLDRRWPFVILTLLLTITLLIYTVMAAFMMLFLGLLVPALWLVESAKLRAVARKDPRASESDFADSPPPVNRRPVIALALAGSAALGLATLIYYGQYIPLILQRTLPYFLQSAGTAQAGVVPEHQPFLSYLAGYGPLTSYLQRPVAYGIQLALLLAAISLAGLRRPRLRAVMICWAAVAVVFTIIGSRIAMVDKQIFYLLPALALLAGRLFSWLWQRGSAARLIVASAYLFTFLAALDLWIYRIATIRQ